MKICGGLRPLLYRKSVDQLGSPSSPSAGSDLAAAIGLRRRELGALQKSAFTALAESEDPLSATALGNAVGGPAPRASISGSESPTRRALVI